MAYADYDFYVNEYGGNAIAEADFKPLANKASVYIDAATMGRANTDPVLEAVKMCCCALSEQYQIINTAEKLAMHSLIASTEESGEIASETVGSWSRSYHTAGNSAQAAIQAAAESKSALIDTVKLYLGNTGMLKAVGYRGCSR